MTVLPDEVDIPYKSLVIGFALAVYLLHSYLDLRQLKAIKLPSPPKQLQIPYEPAEYKKTQAYQLDKWWFGAWKGLFNIALSIAHIQLNFYAICWGVASGLLWKADVTNEIWVTLLYFTVTTLVQLVISVPFSLYGTFVVEERHGFNNQKLGLFFWDLLKTVLVGTLLLPVIALFTYVLQHTGPYAPLYLWLVLLGVQLVALTIYPTIQALFNKFDPLPAGELREGIEELAGSLAFPLKKLYVIDGSKRSAHSNAYMYGFFKNKRIVLFDTLIEQCSQSQVVAVLAHELGHWKLNHTVKNLVISQIQILATFFVFTLVRNSKGLPKSFGFGEHAPAFIAFELFQQVSAPIDEVLGLLFNVLSRKFEYEADAFAVGLGKKPELKEALVKLDRENRSAINVDAWYSAYHHSHPPLVERLKAIDSTPAPDKKTS